MNRVLQWIFAILIVALGWAVVAAFYRMVGVHSEIALYLGVFIWAVWWGKVIQFNPWEETT